MSTYCFAFSTKTLGARFHKKGEIKLWTYFKGEVNSVVKYIAIDDV